MRRGLYVPRGAGKITVPPAGGISFVGAGAADLDAGSSGAVLTPGAPAGIAQDDILLMYGWERSNTTGATFSAGTSIFNNGATNGGRTILYWKKHNTGDPMPTFTAGGVAANATCIAQIAAFRGVHLTTPIDVSPALSSNASAQNIGPVSGITPLTAGAVVVCTGAKLDDWTSVATLSGDVTWAEIGEPSTTLGNDGGIVWDYGTGWTSGAIAAKTFTVTGGAAQTGQGCMLALKPA